MAGPRRNPGAGGARIAAARSSAPPGRAEDRALHFGVEVGPVCARGFQAECPLISVAVISLALKSAAFGWDVPVSVPDGGP